MSASNLYRDDRFSGLNSVFVEELYQKYKENPQNVDDSWRQIFQELGDDAETVFSNVRGASWAPKSSKVIGAVDAEELAKRAANKNKGVSEEALYQAAEDSVRALMLIRAYRVRGHFHANLDPLHIEAKQPHPELDPATYGFSEADQDKPIHIHGVLGLRTATIREILAILKRTYCRTIGVEFMHIQHPEQKAWIQSRIEANRGDTELQDADRKAILRELVEVESFESFLQVKYPGMKRFSVQGGDAMIPGMEMVIRTSAALGVEEVVIGMPHRGRMNVLTTVMKKPFKELFSLFLGNLDYPEDIKSSGDVKYHLGTSSDRSFGEGKQEVHLSLTPNPSHLEAVNPVVAGRVRAKQDLRQDPERKRVMGILLHGDAAFAGQGIVAETLGLSELQDYSTGGTLHFIVNNQIGFTTSPRYSRSSPYPSDVAKMVGAPIFHVNGDDPEAVVYVSKLAAEFRHEFKKDVVIDMFCYRRYGHNESDEPMFTQPLMYNAIKDHESPARMYAKSLVSRGLVTQADVDQLFEDYKKQFDQEFELAKDHKPNKADWLEGHWSGFMRPDGEHPVVDTGVDRARLKEVGLKISAHPEGYTLNKKILRQLDAKREMIESGKEIDWATAEALAFGTLLTEGYGVRVSGQDCRRGTFSQRHASLVDQENEERYVPLANLSADQKRFEIMDSNLSEFGVLGFEYGYSLAAPNTLTIWEAQFGDFCNGAQIIIDQFISSGEMKWLRMSGLVMLLPHGFEGQGPEHSSARLERFLQMCAQDNMQVANCSTPANYYHILRRQMHAKFRKPLIMMTPKSLLRHKLCVSTLEEMAKATHFIPVYDEAYGDIKPKDVKRVVLCSGKVYYDLVEAREAKGVKDVAILRLEQFYPFPHAELKKALKPYAHAELVWCQEEPENMGAWFFLDRRLEKVLVELKAKHSRPVYAGRPEAASPAAGYLKIHNREQEALVSEALGL